MKILLIFILTPFSVLAESCFPLENAKARIIYLHGMDVKDQSPQERKNRSILKKLAQEKRLELFLPRSSKQCPESPNQICWMWNSEKAADIEKKKLLLIKKSKACFKSDAPLLWLGFSNGGNHLNQFFQSCSGGTYITIGASGGYLKTWQQNLFKCGKLYTLIGEDDEWNYRPGLKFYQRLKSSKAQNEVIPFKGGHEIDALALESLISELLK